MIDENEYYYESDEDDYEDFDDDETYDAEQYYLSEAKIDNLIHTIRMYGSKHQYEEIEQLILATDEDLVFKWIQDLDDGKQPTFLQIEKLLDTNNSKLKTTTFNKQTPPDNKMREKTLPLHEKLNKEIQFDTNDEKLSAYSTILPSSNLTYYDLSPYVNTAEVFYKNIVQLKQEIRRILTESGVTIPTIQETAINKELEALTGYNTTLFAQPTKTLSTSPTKPTPTSPTESTLPAPTISQPDTPTLINTETKGTNSNNQLSALAAEFIPKFSSKS